MPMIDFIANFRLLHEQVTKSLGKYCDDSLESDNGQQQNVMRRDLWACVANTVNTEKKETKMKNGQKNANHRIPNNR